MGAELMAVFGAMAAHPFAAFVLLTWSALVLGMVTHALAAWSDFTLVRIYRPAKDDQP